MRTTTNRRQLFPVLVRLRKAYGATSSALRKAYGATNVCHCRAYGATSPALAKPGLLLILLQASLFTGCGQKQSPSIDVFGSYFPAWLISLLVGVVLTIIAGALGHLFNFRPSGFLAFLLNVSLILIFSVSVWFWFFAG